MKKGSKSVKNQPFAKKEPAVSVVPLAVALLIAFNFAYGYAIGIPFPRAVVAAYVESVYALGDAQEKAYNTMGAAVVGAIDQISIAK